MVILSVVSAKGGVGKTTLAANLATSLAKTRDVYALDLDPQNALKLHFGVGSLGGDGVARAYLDRRRWSSCAFKAQGLHILPFGSLSDEEYGVFERHLLGSPERILSELRGLSHQSNDLIVVDTPTGLPACQNAVLRMSNYVVVVVQSDFSAYATLPAMQERVRKHCLGRADFRGVFYLINNVYSGSRLSRDLIGVMRAQLKDQLISDIVHQDEAIKEALAFEKSVLEYAPGSEAAADISKVSIKLEKVIFPYGFDRFRSVKIDQL